MTMIASIPKRPGEDIRISVEEFQGKKRVNVRVWWGNPPIFSGVHP